MAYVKRKRVAQWRSWLTVEEEAQIKRVDTTKRKTVAAKALVARVRARAYQRLYRDKTKK